MASATLENVWQSEEDKGDERNPGYTTTNGNIAFGDRVILYIVKGDLDPI